MKRLSKKAVLLFVGAMAVCAFVMPSLASAASWTVVGSHHVLTSPNIGFSSNADALGNISSNCTASSFTFRVLSSADAQITSGSFGGLCTATGAGIGSCTVTTALTNLPWTATAVSTTNVQIHGVDIDITFETAKNGAACNIPGNRFRITGTLNGGFWTGNSATAGGGRRVTFDNDSGLVSHSAVGNGTPVSVSGTFVDTQDTLNVD